MLNFTSTSITHYSLQMSFSLITLFLIFIFLNLTINIGFSISKFSGYIFFWRNSSFHPWVCNDLIQSRSGRRIQMKHLLYKVLEIFCEEILIFLFQMCLPKDICSISGKTSIKWVIWLSSSKWWMFSNHDEKNNGTCENIDWFSIIFLTQMDFGGHIITSSKIGAQCATPSLPASGPAKPKSAILS